MKNINQLTKNLNVTRNANTSNNHVLNDNINSDVKKLVDGVFIQLEAIYPSTFRHVFSNEDKLSQAKKEWVKAFFENGINTVELVKSGLVAARSANSDFIPSCGKFCTWCLKLDADDSYERFIDRLPAKDYAELLTKQRVGYECRQRLSEEKAKRLWNSTIKKIRAKIATGEIVDSSPKNAKIAPPAKVSTVTEEQRNNTLDAKIKEMQARGEMLIGVYKKRYEELNK